LVVLHGANESVENKGLHYYSSFDGLKQTILTLAYKLLQDAFKCFASVVTTMVSIMNVTIKNVASSGNYTVKKS